MNILADVLNNVKTSASNQITQIARNMKNAGHNVIALSSGEPDFDTPEHIKQAAIQAMQKGETKYPPINGIIQLKNAIIQKLQKENNLFYHEEQIIVSNGAKQVIFNALMATINPGDEVIILSPYWTSYPEIISLCRGIPIIVKGIVENNFKISAKSLEKAITSKTKWIIFNSPSNPTGSVYSYEEMSTLADILLNFPDVWIMEDDIYEKLIYDNNKFYTFPKINHDLIKRCLIINGVSKTYAMTGWRVGYGAGPKKLIKAMSIIQSQTTSGVSTISQWAAVAALTQSQHFFKKWKSDFLMRRNYVVSQINSIKGLKCQIPQGSFYVYPSCIGIINKVTKSGKIIKNDKDFTKMLLIYEGIAVVSGSAFGLNMHFRLSYAVSMKDLKKACLGIQNFCENLK